ncbi:hypothetical protein EVG20_g2018 [Dentipellis fragilis]|uniref:RRM domain-containing protein n=1 Tax=Dentipellis fragilis TaxID=205917 RepID=A0A4Y9ZC63_9AGAM|nr:hypothetical protein EVG20_g2018 [Dentipellis fragilis]
MLTRELPTRFLPLVRLAMDCVDCVVDITTSLTEQQVRSLLVDLGAIAGIYLWRTDKDSRHHFFVQFNDLKSVTNACALSSPHLDVHSLVAESDVADRFRSIVQGTCEAPLALEDPLHTSTSNSSVDPLEAEPLGSSKRKRTRRAGVRLRLRQAMNTDLDFDKAALPPGPPALDSALKSRNGSSIAFPVTPADLILTSRLRSSVDKENYPQQSGHIASSPLPVPAVSTRRLPAPLMISGGQLSCNGSTIPSGLPNLQSTLVLSLCGESISYDLNTLDDNPEAIINLLTTTGSDRGKWMIVGAFYRRKGKVAAAAAVISAMINGIVLPQTSWRIPGTDQTPPIVMKSHGMADKDMSPAFLMLATCETELGRQARSRGGEETIESTAHLEQARFWLQNVYGSGTSGQRLEAAVLRSSQGKGGTRNGPLPGSGAQLAEQRILRDLQQNDASELLALRVDKRRLEDQYSHERVQRRKLEASVQDLKKELMKSRQLESSALEQVRAEVEARRGAEERAKKERDMRLRLEAEWDRMREKEEKNQSDVEVIFKDLAAIFQRAANGDPASVSNLLPRRTSSHRP